MAEVEAGKITPPKLVGRAYHPLRKRKRDRVIQMPEEAFCLSKTLSANEVGDGGRLYLNAHEAGQLISCPEIGEKGTTLVVYYTVYDIDHEKYDMTLSNGDGELVYTIYGEWERFVWTHNLKAGDSVSFYKIAARPLPRMDNHYCVCIMYTRNEDPTHKKHFYNVRKNMPSGSGVSGAGPSNEA